MLLSRCKTFEIGEYINGFLKKKCEVVVWSLCILETPEVKESKTDYRSSHRRCSLRKGVLRNFAKFTGKQLCQSLFFNKAVFTK